jgi:hypothetical protein
MAIESRFPDFAKLAVEDQVKLKKVIVKIPFKPTWTDPVKSDMLDSAGFREYGDKLKAVGVTSENTETKVEPTKPKGKEDKGDVKSTSIPVLVREFYIPK